VLFSHADGSLERVSIYTCPGCWKSIRMSVLMLIYACFATSPSLCLYSVFDVS